jgi:uncharacterized membrane protein YdjX (TVP38/TMEM64 family)
MLSDRARTRLRKLAVLGALVLLLTAWRLGLLESFSDPERLRDALRGLGPTGYAAFVAAFMLLQPFGVPGTVFVIGATYVWPRPVAYALSLTAAVGASNVGFLFARFVARDWVRARMPARLLAYDERLEQRALATALVLRGIFWMNPILHGFFGLSRVPFSTHLFATVVTLAPTLAFLVWVGGTLFDRVRELPGDRLLVVVVAAALVAAGVWLVRRRAAQAAAAPSRPEP